MNKLNKYYIDSSWRSLIDVSREVKIIKKVSKKEGFVANIKIIENNNFYDVYIKLNKIKK